jgi:hypothetical protein
MPFTPRDDLPDNPDVRIFFSGLMLIRPRPNSETCEVFVHRSAPDHQLTIEVRQKQQPGKPDLIMMRHVGPLPYALSTLPPPTPPTPAGPLIHGMIIQVETAPKGVQAYNGNTESTEGAALDDNTVVNFQSDRFHDGHVAGVDQLGGRPSILLNDGVFYTADKTIGDIELTRVGDPPGTSTHLSQIASLIGANIYLDDGDSVLVRFQAQGLLEQVNLNKQSGISYEIYIINDPLFESDSPNVPAHDEFKEYYKILLATPPPTSPTGTPPDQFPLADQFRLKITPKGRPHRGSTRTPCMSGIIDP